MTDQPLTEDDLAQIEARCEAATPGEWRWQDWQTPGDPDTGPHQYTLTAPPETMPCGPSKSFPTLRNLIISDEEPNISEADKAFIAHARTDVPKLLAEVRRLRARLGEG